MIELFNIDCMEYMRDQPDKAFDLAIVDPPYGINLKGPCGHFKQYGTLQKVNENSPDTKYFRELARISKNQIIWGANYFEGCWPSRCFVVWDKGPQMYGRSFADCEIASVSIDGPARIFKHGPNVNWRFHPTQKPVKLYDFLLTSYAKPGQRILDTHLGSGSSAIAAHYFGVDFVGCEIDEHYFNLAKQRIDQETRQIAMF